MEAKLNPAFQAAIDAKSIPGVAAIVLDSKGNTLFKTALGTTQLDSPDAAPYTSSTPTIMWSCTKVIASIAALQLVEQGKLSLDDPIEKYVPEIKDIQVLDGFDDNGKPKYRAPKSKPTVLQCLTHTAGFSYDFFDGPTFKWRNAVADPTAPVGVYLAAGSWACFTSPLRFDPGTQYMYGVNIDWAGFVVEAISGMKLNEYVQKHILDVLDMKQSGSHIDVSKPWLKVHAKADGKLTANPEVKCAENPDRYGGGHYLYSTLDDYSQFLLTLLNRGAHPVTGARILKAETVDEYLFKDMIPRVGADPAGVGKLADLPLPPVSLEGEFLPGTSKGWSCGLMLSNEDTPGKRGKGSGAWAGLGNNYFWVDPVAGKAGLILSAILPFMDLDVLDLFDKMEEAAYA